MTPVHGLFLFEGSHFATKKRSKSNDLALHLNDSTILQQHLIHHIHFAIMSTAQILAASIPSTNGGPRTNEGPSLPPGHFRAIVKSSLNGTSVILRGRPMGGQMPKERTLYLAHLVSPKTGNREREDEKWAFESRDFLRNLVVGKVSISWHFYLVIDTTTSQK